VLVVIISSVCALMILTDHHIGVLFVYASSIRLYAPRTLPPNTKRPTNQQQEAQVKTESGGFIFCLIAAVLLLLGMAELRAFWQAPYTDRILVDHTLDQKLRIDLDITFLAIPCRQVQLVAMDVAGENQLAFKSTIHKKRISRATGNSVGVRVKVRACVRHGCLSD
jgi:hypothetical protein